MKIMSTKVTVGGAAALIVGAVAQAAADQGLTLEELVGVLVTAAATWFIGWATKERNPSPSTVDAVERRQGIRRNLDRR